jgi:hypothetical protein
VAHKFAVGQIVHFRPSVRDRHGSGLYLVSVQLPERGGEFQYRIKHPKELHERIARESELNVG